MSNIDHNKSSSTHPKETQPKHNLSPSQQLKNLVPGQAMRLETRGGLRTIQAGEDKIKSRKLIERRGNK